MQLWKLNQWKIGRGGSVTGWYFGCLDAVIKPVICTWIRMSVQFKTSAAVLILKCPLALRELTNLKNKTQFTVALWEFNPSSLLL